MKIILAFDSFKGSLTAEEAVNAAAKGIIKVCPHAKIIRPVSYTHLTLPTTPYV